MNETTTHLIIPIIIAMFLAINMGASGTAPSFSAAYGANVLKKSVIPGLFGIMVLFGAIMAGEKVTLTMGNDILNQSFFTPLTTSIILISVSLSLLFANLLGVPQSTSQSSVLSIAGAAIALDNLNSEKLFFEIIPTWFLLPLISFSIVYIFSKLISFMKEKVITDDFSHLKEHKLLRFFLIVSSLYVAFTIGSNNVANAAGPIASLTANELHFKDVVSSLPIIILSILVVAPCFSIGSSLMGHKVTETTGKEIIKITPFYATVISFVVATLLLLASMTKGIPTSLVQLNAGAFFALSASRHGFKETFSNKIVKRFFMIWAVAPIFSFIVTYLLIKLFIS